MPSQKNQHYVPRCALRPFTSNTEGRAINLFNIDANRSIENAPVKGQCSRDYFYGKDLRAENALAKMEGQYARIAAALIDGNDLNGEEEDWLRLFVIVQSRRTASAIEELRSYSVGMTDEAFKRHPDQRPDDLGHEQLVALSMSSGVRLHEYWKRTCPLSARSATSR